MFGAAARAAAAAFIFSASAKLVGFFSSAATATATDGARSSSAAAAAVAAAAALAASTIRPSTASSDVAFVVGSDGIVFIALPFVAAPTDAMTPFFDVAVAAAAAFKVTFKAPSPAGCAGRNRMMSFRT